MLCQPHGGRQCGIGRLCRWCMALSMAADRKKPSATWQMALRCRYWSRRYPRPLLTDRGIPFAAATVKDLGGFALNNPFSAGPFPIAPDKDPLGTPPFVMQKLPREMSGLYKEKAYVSRSRREVEVYKEIGKVVMDALQSWAKTMRLCVILSAVAAAGTVALLVM